MIKRRKTKIVKIGDIKIGGANPIAVQSMAKVKTSNVVAVCRQIKRLQEAGCQIIRLAIKDRDDAKAVRKIKKTVETALVADIHFDYRLALESVENGIDKIRLNPGNIYKREEVKEVVKRCKERKIPIRIGLNSGSLPSSKSNSRKIAKDITLLLIQSASDYIKLLEDMHFFDIVVSLKSSNVVETIKAYEGLARLCEYPFHLGVTAAGPLTQGLVKSSLGLGILLFEGIGDTIRVSLTATPEEEVNAAKYILQSLGLSRSGLDLITCPTCGRCEVDLVNLVKNFEKRLDTNKIKLNGRKKALKIALMGCVVNGPGEARDADLGIAFGKKEGLFFRHGKPQFKINQDTAIETILKAVKEA